MAVKNPLGNSQRTTNTKRVGRPADRKNKGHPMREARRQRAYDRGAPRPKE